MPDYSYDWNDYVTPFKRYAADYGITAPLNTPLPNGITLKGMDMETPWGIQVLFTDAQGYGRRAPLRKMLELLAK